MHFLWMLTAAKIAVVSSVIAFVYVNVLVKPGSILSFWREQVHKWYSQIFGMGTDKYYQYRWVLKPIVECDRCVAGQIAFWAALFTVQFSFITIIFITCLSILLTMALARLLL